MFSLYINGFSYSILLSFIDTINKDTELVLANAIHFKCGWKHTFLDAIDEPFYISKDNKVNVKMMTLTKNLYYYHDENLKFKALELPYDVSILTV